MDHIFQDAAHSLPDGFMRINYTPGPEGEKKTSRVLDFAENLFNLQHIEGFDDRVNQMRTGTIEAAFAEPKECQPKSFPLLERDRSARARWQRCQGRFHVDNPMA
jgi:hypothetical protein